MAQCVKCNQRFDDLPGEGGCKQCFPATWREYEAQQPTAVDCVLDVLHAVSAYLRDELEYRGTPLRPLSAYIATCAGGEPNIGIDKYEEGDLFISTARNTDSQHPFETAVSHPKYNNNALVIVAEYDTKEEAQEGHDKWVRIMTAPELPAELRDVSTAGIAELCEAVGGDDFRTQVNADCVGKEPTT